MVATRNKDKPPAPSGEFQGRLFLNNGQRAEIWFRPDIPPPPQKKRTPGALLKAVLGQTIGSSLKFVTGCVCYLNPLKVRLTLKVGLNLKLGLTLKVGLIL